MSKKKRPPAYRVQLFQSRVPVQSAQGAHRTHALEVGLRRAGTPVSGSCGKLLGFVLDNLCPDVDGSWLYRGSVRLAADAVGVHHKQARRCVLRYIRNGLFEPVGVAEPRKPRTYRVRLDA